MVDDYVWNVSYIMPILAFLKLAATFQQRAFVNSQKREGVWQSLFRQVLKLQAVGDLQFFN
ncbi:unnamed protein product, partial [Vitis vinifera]|uniref:Uncharacterized protein n=1 Tax=Vitis vinifera TaxID=29760 RepID=D7SZT7_VITVI